MVLRTHLYIRQNDVVLFTQEYVLTASSLSCSHHTAGVFSAVLNWFLSMQGMLETSVKELCLCLVTVCMCGPG